MVFGLVVHRALLVGPMAVLITLGNCGCRPTDDPAQASAGSTPTSIADPPTSRVGSAETTSAAGQGSATQDGKATAGASSPESNAPSVRTDTASAAADEPLLPSLWNRRDGVDWPTFLGPTGDGISPETGTSTQWPAEGPRIVWQRELQESYGIGSVAAGRFFQGDREGDQAVLVCLNAETGDELWKHKRPTTYLDLYGYNGGPRCSPIIDGNRVYMYGVDGVLECLHANNGEPIWQVDTQKQFGVVQNFFGVGSTPVIEGELLIVMVGGSPAEDQRLPPGALDRLSGNGSGIVAFDKRTGNVKYRITDELASYSSLKSATIDGRRWCFAFCRGGLVGFEPSSGQVDFHYPWRDSSLESVNASTPVVVGNEVFLSETYGIGSSLLRVRPGAYEVVWSDEGRRRDKAFEAHWNTPIYFEGHLYGCSGRNPPDSDLRCIEWKTGQLKWSLPLVGLQGESRVRSSLTLVDGHLLCLGETGRLQWIKPDPARCEVVADVILVDPQAEPVPGFGPRPLLRYPCWAAPVVSHGLLYVRGRDRLVCLELRAD